MPSVIIPPTDVSPNTGTGSEVLSNAPTLVNPVVTGTVVVSGNVTAADLILGTNGPSVESSLSARAPRQALVFDGTAGANVTNIPAFGTGDFTFAAWVNQPTLGAAYLCSETVAPDAAFLYLVGDGTFQWWSNTAARATSSAGAFVANKWMLLVAARTGGTVTLYADGISVGSGADTQNITAAIDRIGMRANGASILNGSVLPIVYNRALSAAEIKALYERGAPAAADYGATAASNTALNSSSFVNISYSTFSGASATGFTAANAANTTQYAKSAPVFSVRAGNKIRVSCTVSITSGQAPFVVLAEAGVANYSAATQLSAGANVVELVATGANSNVVVQFYTTAISSYSISAADVKMLGLLLAPDAAQTGGGLTWYDTSGNSANITLPASGVGWNVPFSGNVTSSSALNLRAGGSNQNISLQPSGSGDVRIIGGAFSTLRFFDGATQKGSLFFSTADNALQYNDSTSTSVKLFTGAAADSLVLSQNGYLLLGVSNPGNANGRIQLANHTTSAGGIGFWTDTALYRNAAGQLALDATNNVPALTLRQSGTNAMYLYTSSLNGFIGTTNANSLTFQTGTNNALVLDSSQNATFAKDVLLGTSGPSVPSTLSGRAPRQGLSFDGTAAASLSGPTLGTLFTIAFTVRLTSLAAQTPLIFVNGGNFIGVRVTTGALFYSGAASDFTSTVSINKATQVVIVGNGTTATPYIDGVAGTPIAFTSSMPGIVNLNYIGNPALQMSGLATYNRALSAAEVKALYETGVPEFSDLGIFGSIAPSNTGLTTSSVAQNFQYDTFSATTNSFTAVETGGQACEANFISGTTFLGKASKNSRYLVQFTATLTSGAVPTVRLSVQGVSGVSSAIVNVAAGANSIPLQITEAFTAETGTGSGRVTFATSANTSYAISGLTVTRLGAVLAPDAAQTGGGLTWYDTSGNAANITLPASGVTWTVPTSGNLYLFGLNGLTLDTNGSATVRYADNNISKWWIYKLSGDLNLYIRDMVNSRMQAVFTPGANSNTAVTAIQSNLEVSGNRIALASGALLGMTGTAGALSTANYALFQDSTQTFLNVATSGSVQLRVNNVEQLRVFSNGNVGIGVAGLDSGSKLQVGTDTTAASGGMIFGTDVNLYRSAANTLRTDDVFQSAAGIASGSYLGGTELYLNNAAGTVRAVYWQTAGVSRWAMYANNTAEGGGNAGSNLTLSRYSDAGAYLGDALSCDRASGNSVFGSSVGIGGISPSSRLHVYENTSGTGDSNGITIEQAGTADVALQLLLTGVQRWTVGVDNSDSDKFKIGAGAVGSADRLTLDTTGNATLAGSITTSAPTGGAGAWELGIANTVTPTAPNRTLTVEIGGTVYYIHAKTTND